MFEKQEIIAIQKSELLEKVREMNKNGYRIIQMSCTVLDDDYIIDYSFDRENKFIDLRVVLKKNDLTLPSISSIYLAAFVYENEIHDLFGVKITDIAVDFQGKFYRIDENAPFSKPEAVATSKKGE